MMKACVAVGQELQELRLLSGRTQEEVRVAVGYKKADTVSGWERGEHLPTVGRWPAIASLYGVTPDEFKQVLQGKRTAAQCVTERTGLMGAGIPAANGLGIAQDPVEEDATKRRQVIFGAVAAAGVAAEGSMGFALEPLRSALEQAWDLPDRTLEGWEEVVWSCGQAYYVLTAEEMLPRLTREMRALAWTVQHTEREHLRQALAVPSSQLAVLMALTMSDLGDEVQSRNWWSTARHMADTSGYLRLQVWVRGIEAQRLRTSDVPIALRRATEAVALGERLGPMDRWEPLSGQADALAAAGDVAGSRAALAALQRGVSSVAPGVALNALTMGVWNELSLHFGAAIVHTYNKDLRAARDAVEAGLCLCPPSMKRRKASLEFLRATCLVHEGCIQEGVEHATGLVADLSVHDRTPTVSSYARQVLTAVPASELRRSMVGGYRDALAEMELGRSQRMLPRG